MDQEVMVCVNICMCVGVRDYYIYIHVYDYSALKKRDPAICNSVDEPGGHPAT